MGITVFESVTYGLFAASPDMVAILSMTITRYCTRGMVAAPFTTGGGLKTPPSFILAAHSNFFARVVALRHPEGKCRQA